MAQNFSDYLSSLQDRKSKLLKIAKQACEYGWIPATTNGECSNKGVISLEEIVSKLENDTLTIGVIGQMKCGKSTFLNSFIFENDILPAATTPMTAALSVITYGEVSKIVAEFYTEDEWAEQVLQSKRDENDAANSLDQSKIKAAKELVEKSVYLGSSLNSFLGKTKEDKLDNLIEYVGADGKFISITKSVTIYYPKEYLKGVQIVDTPGFNDPIVSREERTKDFLKRADVVIMMLYAGRPFDATDRDIIFKNVRQCGIGKVLVGINKYDIPFTSQANPEDEEQIKQYVKDEIRKACRECDDNTLVEILSEVEPIPLSAEMALLSELPMSKISSSDAFKHAWERHCRDFGISTQDEMRKWSHLEDFVKAIKSLIDGEKSAILFAKPLNAIIAAGSKKKSEINNDLTIVNSKIEQLMMPDSELDEVEDNLSKANRRLSKKIDTLEEDINSAVSLVIRKGTQELEDLVDSSCSRMKSILHNEWGLLKSYKTVAPRIEGEFQNLLTRQLKRATTNLADEVKNKMDRCIGDYFEDAEDVLMRFIPSFDSRSFVSQTRSKVQMEVESSIFVYDAGESEEETFGFGNFVWEFLRGFSLGALDVLDNAFSHNEILNKVESSINALSSEFDPKPYLEEAVKNKDQVITTIRQDFITNLIEPLQNQIQEIRDKKDKSASELETAKEQRTVLEAAKESIEAQINEVQSLKERI